MIALATDTTRVLAGVEPASGPIGLLEGIRRIVDARRVPADYQGVCNVPDCAACTRVRATRFDCAVCGYQGHPIGFVCGCANAAESRVRMDHHILSTYPTAASWPTDWKTPRRKVAIDARRLRTLLAEQPVGLCLGEGKGQPPALDNLVGFEGNCCHGIAVCPTCGAYGDGGENPDDEAVEYLLAMLGELRTVLAAAPEPEVIVANGPYYPRSIRAMGHHGVVVDVVEVGESTIDQPAGCFDLEVQHIGYAGSEALSVRTTGAGLDTLITALTAARASALAKGIIPGVPS
jgi:hypothetical protein